MAENVIQKSDVSVEDVYGWLTASNKKYQDQVIKTTESIKAESLALQAELNIVEQFTQKGLDALMVARKESNALQKEKATQDKKVLAISKDQVALDKKVLTAKIRLQEARKKETAQIRRMVKVQQAEKGSIESLRARLSVVTHEWTKLTKAETKNTLSGRRLTKNKLDLTNQLKRLEQATGDNRRSVGNYQKATNSLGGSLRRVTRLAGQFGLALGGAQIIRGTIGLLTEFDEKLADIIKTTKLSKQGAQELSQELLKIDTRTSITNLQELASAAGRLGITGKQNILDFAEAADKVFVALGDDLEGTAEEIATNLGKISSLFGLEDEFGTGLGIEKVGSALNELSANSKASAGAILNFTQRMGGLASVLELSDVQALGALFDESGQSMEVASSTLNKLLPALASDYKRFAKVAGLLPEEFKKIAEESPIEALKLVATGAKSSEKGLFALTDVIKSFGVDSARATGIVGVLTDNVERLGVLQNVATEAMEKNESITDEFNTKNQTLGAIYEKLVNKIKAYVLGSEGAMAVTTNLGKIMGFIGKNLGTIVFWLGKAIKAYVLYQIVTSKVVKGMQAFGVELIKNNGNLKKTAEGLNNTAQAADEAGTGMTNGAKSAKALGGALKAIGFALAITLAVEFAQALFLAASGANDLADAAKRLEFINKKSAIRANERVDARNKEIKANFRLLEQQAELDKAGKSTSQQLKIDKKLLAAKEALIEANAKVIQGDISAVISKKTALEADREILKSLKAAVGLGNDLTETQKEHAKRLGIVGKEVEEVAQDILSAIGGVDKFQQAFNKLDAEIAGAVTKVIIYNEETANSRDILNELGHEIEVLGAKAKGDTEERISLLRKIEDERIKQIKDDNVRQLVKAESDARRATEDLALTNALESEKSVLIKEIAESLEQDLEALYKKFADKREKDRLARLKADAELVRKWRTEIEASIDEEIGDIEPEDILRTDAFTKAEKERRLELLKTGKTNEEVEEEMTKFSIEQLKKKIAIRADILDGASEEELKKLKGVEDEKLDLEIQLEGLLRDRRKEASDEVLDLLEDQFDKILDLSIQNSKDLQKLLDDQINKQQEVVDSLRKGANEGNAIADKSLALEETRLEERENAKREEAKKEAILEEIKMLWNAINSFMDQGDSFPEAFAKGFGGVATVKAGAKLIGSFFTGTKGRLKDEDSPTKQGRDGHLIWADGEEGIFTGNQMDRLENAGLGTTEGAVQSALLGAQLKGGSMPVAVKQNGAVGYDMKAVEKEIKGMRKDLANRPTQVLSPWILEGLKMGLSIHEKQNGIENILNKPFDT